MYPDLHEQENDPSVLVQDAAASHGLLVVHSLISRRGSLEMLASLESLLWRRDLLATKEFGCCYDNRALIKRV